MSSMLLTGVGKGGAAALAAGYYWRSGDAEADFPDPTPANFTQATTLVNDVGLNDHTTYVSQVIDADVSLFFVQALYALSSLTTLTSYTASLYYGPGATITCKYWDGAAWQDFTGAAWAGHVAYTWEDGDKNAADQETMYLLLTIRTFSDTAAAEIRIGDFRPVAA